MAFTEFYMQTTGSDLNSGSTTADAAVYTSTGGNFDGTSIFTPTDGSTPASSINVGDYVSLYNTGDTVVRCIAKVTAVDAGVNGAVTVDTTLKYGTVPTSNSGSRALKAGGALASFAVTAANAAFNTGTVPQSTRVNIKAGTYANTTTSRGFAMAGAATTPLEWAGYKTTPGDMDTASHGAFAAATEVPLITFTTGSVNSINASSQTFRNLDFQGATNGTAVVAVGASAAVFRMSRVRIENTNAAAGSRALTMTNAGSRLNRCWFKATQSAQFCISASSDITMFGCVIIGADRGINLAAASRILFNIFSGQDEDGIYSDANAVMIVMNNTIYNAGRDGIRINSVGAAFSLVAVNNVFSVLVGTAINNASGANIQAATRINNLSHSVAAQEGGFGDSPSSGWLTDSSSPFTTAGTDFGLVSTSNGKAGGFPGAFENLSSTIGYLDCGAVQRQEAASGGGAASLINNDALVA